MRPTLASAWPLTFNHGIHQERRLGNLLSVSTTYLLQDPLWDLSRVWPENPKTNSLPATEPLTWFQGTPGASEITSFSWVFRHRLEPEQSDLCLPHGFSGLPEPHPGTGLRQTKSPSPSGTDRDLANGLGWRRNQDSRTWLMLRDCPAS